MIPARQFGRGGVVTLLFLCGCVARIGDAPGGSEPAPAGTGGSQPPPRGSAGGAGGAGGSVGTQPPPRCQNRTIRPGRAPVRRLTRFEYNNTVRDLLGDTTGPAVALPSDEIANGFGNDAEALSVSSLLVEQYGTVAEGIAARATQPAALGRLVPCAATATVASEESCTRTFIGSFAPRAYRRPVTPAEVDELLALEKSVRAGSGFA